MGAFAGAALTFGLLYYYLKYIKPKRKIPSLFDLSDYRSQQMAKLISSEALRNYEENEGLKSVDPIRLPLKFQSQWAEDAILYNIFDKKKTGFYVEIGAFDGIKLSNTYFFESIGWKGILVEPQPVQFAKCRENRPNSICFEVAVGKETGPIELNIIADQNYETWSFVGKDTSHIRDTGFSYKTIMVDKKELNNLMPDNIESIDFISIDVEGFEFEILQTINLKKYLPKVILLENNSTEIQKYLAGFGYSLVYKTWINYFYTKEVETFNRKSIWDNLGIEILG
jgi:FkbM family methyltransferase